ncbi:Eukaryotic translation initiation factor eIF-1, partial [Schaereria dolodes]|nr:Eukaryotic translation initiation factor eIF-1 [Schaereria dolodes]
IPFTDPSIVKSDGDMSSTMASTLPMAAMFTRNKLIGWYGPEAYKNIAATYASIRASVVFALQAWLAETPEQSRATNTPAYFGVGMAFMGVGVAYLPLFLPPPPGQGVSGREAPGPDPFAEADEDTGETKQSQNYIHIRIQQRNGRKTLTTVQGLPKKFDQKKILKVIKKKFACNGTIVNDSEMGEVIQLQGDQRKDVQEFLVDKKDGLELDAKTIKPTPRSILYAGLIEVLSPSAVFLLPADTTGMGRDDDMACAGALVDTLDR